MDLAESFYSFPGCRFYEKTIGYGYDWLAFLDEITKFLLMITKHFNDRPI
ncbi:hypothetical protein [Peribacillus frigoritolerans]|nr:hypothetical protein [Peribacillus frigoritolerans]MED3833602.1 hypothetical protein [Peribacillus frigoritolerans]MED3846955.1 hypothetical protein [Peribacillus frigoritolerans]